MRFRKVIQSFRRSCQNNEYLVKSAETWACKQDFFLSFRFRTLHMGPIWNISFLNQFFQIGSWTGLFNPLIFWLTWMLLELRQYKNDSMESTSVFVLKLPRFFTHIYGEKKKRSDIKTNIPVGRCWVLTYPMESFSRSYIVLALVLFWNNCTTVLQLLLQFRTFIYRVIGPWFLLPMNYTQLANTI